MAALLLAALLAVGPVVSVPPPTQPLPAAEFPRGALRLSPKGHVLLATSLKVSPLAVDPSESALRFIRQYSAALGVGPNEILERTSTVAAGTAGVVVFRRMVQGLPVLDGHLSVGIAEDGIIHSVSSGGVLPKAVAAFKVDAAAATARALSRLDGEVKSVTRLWVRQSVQGVSTLHPYYRIAIVAQEPYRSHIFSVDGVTGEVRASPSQLRRAGMGKAYRVSPSKPYATQWPAQSCETETTTSGGSSVVKHKLCAVAEDVTLLGLKGDGTLTGSPDAHVGRTTVYNCKGATTYTPAACTQTMKANANGDFIPQNLTDYGSNKADPMSELMAYYQVDRHSRFMDSLDSNFAGLPLIPGFTNAYGPSALGFGTGPFDNAFYDPTNGIMVFGQGSTVDFAYDAEVIYHEMTHAACGAIANAQMREDALFLAVSPLGMMMDPFSLNEGNADSFAVFEPGVEDPLLGEFDARGEISLGFTTVPLGPNGYIRNLAPASMKTCTGNGTEQNPGRDAEAHDDGEIWGQFMWELNTGLKTLPQAQGAAVTPLAAPTFRALQTLIAMPTEQQTFGAFAQAVESEVRTQYGEPAGDFVRCVAARRDMGSCDSRVVPVYSGEGPFNDQYVTGAWKAFYYSKAEVYQNQPPSGFDGVPSAHQWKITVPQGATELKINVCDISPALFGAGGSGKLMIQKGKPVTLGVTGSGTSADWQFPISASWTVNFSDCGGGLGGGAKTTEALLTPTGCTGCATHAGDSQDTLAAGDWYFLVTNTGGAASFAKFNAVLSAPVVPTRPPVTVATCTPAWEPIVVVPDAGTHTPDSGTPPDAGAVGEDGGEMLADAGNSGGGDAGAPGAGDAGTGGNPPGTVDAGECEGPDCVDTLPPQGCGCGAGASVPSFLALALVALVRRRRAA